MKVLQLIDSLELGGAERMAVNLANAFSGNGTSYLCATRHKGALFTEIAPEVNFLFLARKSSLDIKAVFHLRKFVQEQGVQIIHAHSTSVFMGLMVKLLYPKVKLIWHDHYGNSELLEHRPKLMLSIATRFVSATIAVNKKLQLWACQALGVAKSKAYYLPNFAQLSKDSVGGIIPGEQGCRIVCLANLRAQKNHPFLIRAFKQWNVKHPNWDLLIVGKIFNDTYFENIKLLISELSLDNKVHMLGSRADVAQILSQSNVGVLTSTSEGLPLSLLEYGMASLPCIATNVGEVGTVLKNGELGYLIESENEEEFLNAINSIVSDTEQAKKRSHAFAKHIKDNYSQNAVMSKLIAIYKRVI